MMLGTEALGSSDTKNRDLQLSEKISSEQLLLLIDTTSQLVQKPHSDLLRYNVDGSLYLEIIQRLKCVNLNKENSKKKFIKFCEEIYESLSKKAALSEVSANTPLPEHILSTIVMTAFVHTNLFSCDFDQFVHCALAKKAFHKALSDVAMDIFKNFKIVSEHVRQKGGKLYNITLSNYENYALECMTTDELKKLTPKNQLQARARVAFENLMGTLIQINLPHIAMTLHEILHFFKSRCFDYDATQKGCYYFAPYFIGVFGFEKAFSFHSDEPDLMGSISLSHQANFFSFLLSAIFEDKILSHAHFNIHTSYSVYDDGIYTQLQSELAPEINSLFAPASNISYYEQQTRTNHRRLDLSGLTDMMRELTSSDSSKSEQSNGKRDYKK